ncbi:hypothetical protein JKF63_05506 [Porcisia hertigi]|uniref:Uncharacterized protein n=1 Tax=Porcisia hertigi TaxID=2761500 RepID=A0A836LGM0_9TRYP|nr:hypothetical protein JKF63_05506 [Porcisia hertigi]
MSDTRIAAMMATEMSRLSPISPLRREVTASMHDTCEDARLNAAPLPHSMSSWVCLDMDVREDPVPCTEYPRNKADDVTPYDQVAVDDKECESSARQATGTTGEVDTLSLEEPLVAVQLCDSENRNASDNAATQRTLNNVTVPKAGCHPRPGAPTFPDRILFAHRGTPTMWPLLTTSFQIQVPVPTPGPGSVPDPPATTAATGLTDDYFLVTALAESASTGHTGFHEPLDTTVDSMCASTGIQSGWRVESLPNSLPLATPQSDVPQSSYEVSIDERDHGTGATSYATLLDAATNSLLTPHVISVATMSLASDGEPCLGECRCAGIWTPTFTDVATHGEHVGPASSSSTLPSPSHGAPSLSDDGTRRFGEVVGNGMQDTPAGRVSESLAEFDGLGSNTSPLSHSADAGAEPRRAYQRPVALFSWRPKPLMFPHDHRRHPWISQTAVQERGKSQAAEVGCAASAPEPNGWQRAALWISRRMSFISSSSLAPSPLPSAVAGSTLSSAAAGAAAAAAMPSSETAPPAASPIFILESSRLWSQACILCLSNSQRAKKRLHQLCDYVWQDLKNHWYPQLRLVLGDHSSVRKLHCNRRTHRRVKSTRSPQVVESTTATSLANTSATAEVSSAVPEGVPIVPQSAMRQRSVSSPCFFNSDWHNPCDWAGYQRMSVGERSATAATRHHYASSSNSTCSSGPSSPPPPHSAKEGMHLYAIMTAEAVVSAAQGLLVFLL